MSSRIPVMLATVALLAVAMPLDAQVYRWVDAEGNVHYTDRPPPEVDAERMSIEVQPTDLETTIEAQRDREENLSLRDQDREDDEHDAEAERRDRENLARSCQQARERVARIESARRLSRVDADGNRHTYDEAERAAALAEARAQVAEWCR
jgi:hypothetical protein